MFGSKKKSDAKFVSGGHTLIDHSVQVKGCINFSGNLDLEGTIIGDVIADKQSDALICVMDKGVVKGKIIAPKVIVHGSVEGNIYSSKHLELASSAVVHGDVHYSVIEMIKGAEVNGSLVHTDPEKTLNAGIERAPVEPVKVTTHKADSKKATAMGNPAKAV
ncbi:MAG: cell shape-determining protein CcmA [Alteromonadaceae bacterium]|nr:MAG: cell shape-determining protein CcmA [Alteromonadaceae bacterium]